jgi:ribosomal protein S12 methylthiotransferase
VGFPGETAAEFAQLAKFVEATRFDAMGAFPYYPEPGTPAAALSDQVPPATRTRRRNALMARQQAIAFSLAAGRVGREMDVIVDGPDASGRCIGRHAGQAPEIDGVCIFARPVPAGSIVQAKVVAAQGYDLVVEATRRGRGKTG